MIRVIQFRAKCIGCNACVEAHQERWRISRKDGKSILIGSKEKKGIFRIEVSDNEYEKNKMAAKNCPVKVIRIEKMNEFHANKRNTLII